MAAHDARPMSPGLALMVARWSKRSARLCPMHRAAMHVRQAATVHRQKDFAMVMTSRQLQYIQTRIVGKSSRKHFTTNDWTTSCKNIFTCSTSRQEDPDAIKQAKCRDSTSRKNPVAAVKELISSEEVDKLRRVTKAGCQLLSSFQMLKTTNRPAKERTQRTIHVGTLKNTFEREDFVSNGLYLNRGIYTKASPLKSIAEVVRIVVAKKRKIKRRQQSKGRKIRSEAVNYLS
ncbi:hypothetical protein F511_15847 [Dorcoceras hygrometricum]|uniref:Uncharacterized protein n=1 Tax=Dorcoceras hygrometricum TaxID=472368 RepID=A0A2Z7CEI8_9LAMI|nr:hypothetical protein F511_15847 [Dorcoceras hygrometricum]